MDQPTAALRAVESDQKLDLTQEMRTRGTAASRTSGLRVLYSTRALARPTVTNSPR